MTGSASLEAPPEGGDADPLIFDSFLWGLLSAVSLNIGSLIGVTCLPSQKTRAILMSFGGGALLFALSIELFGHTLNESADSGEKSTVWAMEASAVMGGLLFAFLNHALNVLGADVRKPSTTKDRFARLRSLLMRRLVARLRKIPFFAVLSYAELNELIQTAMYKERFTAGEIIMSSETRDCGIFFIISGLVRLEIFEEDPREGMPGPSPEPNSPGLGPGARKGLDAKFSRSTTLIFGGPLSTWDLGPNQVFGDMTLLTGSYLRCEAMALETTKVLSLSGHEVARLLKKHTALREAVSLRAVERLRQVAELQTLPDQVLASLSARSVLQSYQPGQAIFRGTVDASTPLICVVHGSIKVKYHRSGAQRIVHACRLLCTEHLKGKLSESFTASALEATSVLSIERADLDTALALQAARLQDEVEIESTTTPRSPRSPLDILGEPEKPSAILHPATVVLRPPKDITGVSEAPAQFDIPGFLPQEVVMPPPVMKPVAPGKDIGLALPGQVESFPPATNETFVNMTSNVKKDILNIGENLGWTDEEPDVGDEKLMMLVNVAGHSHAMNQVTDLDLREREIDLMDGRSASKNSCSSNRRFHSKMKDPIASLPLRPASAGSIEQVTPGSPSLIGTPRSPQSFAEPKIGREDSGGLSCGGGGGGGGGSKGSKEVTAATIAAAIGGQEDNSADRARHRAMMVWLGILIDAVPESLVIGILINKTATSGGGTPSRDAAAAALPFVMGVFLSNLPESMSSSGSMKAHGMRVSTILGMWMATTVLTAAGASLGAVLFPPGSATDLTSEIAIASVEGLAAGAMLTMIAQTMMPEAFEQGGDIVGLSCLMGFLCALSVKLIPI